MGKFYSVHDETLFIYKTGKDDYLDLHSLPDSFTLFDSESSWRISPWIAVIENVPSDIMKKTISFLELELHVRSNISSEHLEDYYLDGDESKLITEVTKAKEPEKAIIRIKLDTK